MIFNLIGPVHLSDPLNPKKGEGAYQASRKQHGIVNAGSIALKLAVATQNPKPPVHLPAPAITDKIEKSYMAQQKKNKKFNRLENNLITLQVSSKSISVNVKVGTKDNTENFSHKNAAEPFLVTSYKTLCSLTTTDAQKNPGEIVIVATNMDRPGPRTLRIGIRLDNRVLTLFKLFTTADKKILLTGTKDIQSERKIIKDNIPLSERVKWKKSERKEYAETILARRWNEKTKINKIINTSVNFALYPVRGDNLASTDRMTDWASPDPTILKGFPIVFSRNLTPDDIWCEPFGQTPIICNGSIPTCLNK